MANATNALRFIFTKDLFYPDITDAMSVKEKQEAEKWLSSHTYQTLYEFARGKRPEHLSSSARFLFEVSNSFFETLTDLSLICRFRKAKSVPVYREDVQPHTRSKSRSPFFPKRNVKASWKSAERRSKTSSSSLKENSRRK